MPNNKRTRVSDNAEADELVSDNAEADELVGDNAEAQQEDNNEPQIEKPSSLPEDTQMDIVAGLPLELTAFVAKYIPVDAKANVFSVSSTWCNIFNDPTLKKIQNDQLNEYYKQKIITESGISAAELQSIEVTCAPDIILYQDLYNKLQTLNNQFANRNHPISTLRFKPIANLQPLLIKSCINNAAILSMVNKTELAVFLSLCLCSGYEKVVIAAFRKNMMMPSTAFLNNAVSAGNVNAVRELLKYKNTQGKLRFIPNSSTLSAAFFNKNEEILLMLLNYKDEEGNYPLKAECLHLGRGIDPNIHPRFVCEFYWHRFLEEIYTKSNEQNPNIEAILTQAYTLSPTHFFHLSVEMLEKDKSNKMLMDFLKPYLEDFISNRDVTQLSADEQKIFAEQKELVKAMMAGENAPRISI